MGVPELMGRGVHLTVKFDDKDIQKLARAILDVYMKSVPKKPPKPKKSTVAEETLPLPHITGDTGDTGGADESEG
jgi:hypothetical protein